MAISLTLFDVVQFRTQDQGIRFIHPHFVSGIEKLPHWATIGKYQNFLPLGFI